MSILKLLESNLNWTIYPCIHNVQLEHREYMILSPQENGLSDN